MSSINCQLFGGFRIAEADSKGSRLPSKKSEALLSYLLMQKGESQNRHKVAELLWSRSAAQQALGSLRQECLKLKNWLAEYGVSLELGHREICLSQDQFNTDVAEFEQCIAEGDIESLQKAFSLYKGDFLQDRPVPDTKYEAWFKRQRERLGQLALSGFHALAEVELTEGNLKNAEKISRTMVYVDPASESSCKVLMQVLDRQGQSAAASKAFMEYKQFITKTYGTSPGKEIVNLHSRITGLYTAENQEESDFEHGHTLPAILVLPFECLGDDEAQQTIAKGLTMDLTVALGRFRNFEVLAHDSSRHIKNKGFDHQTIYEKYGTRYVVEGNVRKSETKLRVNVELIDIKKDLQLWSEIYDRSIEDIFAIQDDITQTVANSIDRRILQLRQYHISRQPTHNPGAYDLVVRAWALLEATNQKDNELALTLSHQALELDDQYSQTHALISIGQFISAQNGWVNDPAATLNEAFEHGIKAVNLDARNHMAHSALGMACLFLHQHDRALRSLRRAVQLNPGSADSKAFLALVLVYCGKPQEALEILQAAIQSNPLHPAWYLQVSARIHYALEEFEEVIALLEEVTHLSPAYGTSQLLRAAAYAAMEQPDQARLMVRSLTESGSTLNLQAVQLSAPYKNKPDLDLFLLRLKHSGLR